MVSKKIVKVDIDGVLRDTFAKMCEIYNNEFGTSMTTEDIHTYDVNVSFPLAKDKYGDSRAYFFDSSNTPVVFGEAKPVKWAAESLRLLRESRFHIAICSHQPTAVSREITLRFLDSYNFKYDSLHFTKNKWIVRSDYIIDDCPDFILHPNETAQKICITYPFNLYIGNPEIWRADNIFEAVQLILKNERK
jgi:5'(3')-deoxyribonucleotidase